MVRVADVLRLESTQIMDSPYYIWTLQDVLRQIARSTSCTLDDARGMLEELRRLGIGRHLAAQTAGSRKGYWHISRSPALNMALTRVVLVELGLPLLLEPETRV